MARKWSYWCLTTLQTDSAENLQKELDDAGKQGYELVAVHECRDMNNPCAVYRYIFKKATN